MDHRTGCHQIEPCCVLTHNNNVVKSGIQPYPLVRAAGSASRVFSLQDNLPDITPGTGTVGGAVQLLNSVMCVWMLCVYGTTKIFCYQICMETERTLAMNQTFRTTRLSVP
jgi:hypothetical protein